jgi:hypothetical protein
VPLPCTHIGSEEVGNTFDLGILLRKVKFSNMLSVIVIVGNLDLHMDLVTIYLFLSQLFVCEPIYVHLPYLSRLDHIGCTASFVTFITLHLLKPYPINISIYHLF